MFKRVLVPTDGSELSEKTVKAAIAFAKEHSCEELIVMTAVGVPLTVTELGYSADAMEEARKAAEERLLFAQKAAEDAGVRIEAETAISQSPAEAIIWMAEQKKCDLIIMASHGRRGMSALLLGSETQKVLVHSKVPVLVYR